MIYNVGSENSLFHGTPLDGAYMATKHSVLDDETFIKGVKTQFGL